MKEIIKEEINLEEFEMKEEIVFKEELLQPFTEEMHDEAAEIKQTGRKGQN